ncbi:uncharacterized protein [Panulirus ornatus]
MDHNIIYLLMEHFLKSVNNKNPTQAQIETFMDVAKRGNLERLLEGDIVLPMKSPKLKEMTGPKSNLGRFMEDPSDENLKAIELAMLATDSFISQVWVDNDLLRIRFDRVKIIQNTIKKLTLAGLEYGVSKLLRKAGVLLVYKVPECHQESIAELRTLKLINYMLRVAKFSGGEVKLQDSENESGPQVHKSENRSSKLQKSRENESNPQVHESESRSSQSQESRENESNSQVHESENRSSEELITVDHEELWSEKGIDKKSRKATIEKSHSNTTDIFGATLYPSETCKPSCSWALSPPEKQGIVEEDTMNYEDVQLIKKVTSSYFEKHNPLEKESEMKGFIESFEDFLQLNNNQKKEACKKFHAFLLNDFQTVASSSFPLRSPYVKKGSVDKAEFENQELHSEAICSSLPLHTWMGREFANELFPSSESGEELESEEKYYSLPEVQPQEQEKEIADDFHFVNKEELEMHQENDKGLLEDLFYIDGDIGPGSSIPKQCSLDASIGNADIGVQGEISDDIISGKLNDADDVRTVQSSVKPELLNTDNEKGLQKGVVNSDDRQEESNAAIKKGKLSPTYCCKDEDGPSIHLLITEGSPGRENISRSLQIKPIVDLKSGKPWNGSEEDYCKILVAELKCAAQIKHGDVSSPEWSKFLEAQARQCMTLQILSVSHSNSAKIEVNGSTQNTKEWAFVLYNYARLSMIFETFEEYVARGDVLPLPPPDDVDFSLLNHEEEWALVWLYILRWPEIPEEMAVAMLDGSRKLKTAAVAQFLHSLSHRFSEYYSRYKVLVSEPLPHLMPLMYARLYLLKAIQTVMKICFNLLGVDSPPTFM